jgi:hypothetical protein
MNEFFKLESYWYEPLNKGYGRTSICKCGARFHDDKWSIFSKIDNFVVSTIDLEMAVSGTEFQDWFDYNYWYETAIWKTLEKGDRDFLSFQIRYKTQEEAVKGHKFITQNINKIIEHPERFPQGTLSLFVNAIGMAQASEKLYSEETKRASN